MMNLRNEIAEASSEEDKYSMDAPYIVEKAGEVYKELGAMDNLLHSRYPGGHAMTKERYDCIVEWLDANIK